MAGSPKDAEEKLNRTLSAWKKLHPDKVLGGMTVEQYATAIEPSFAVRRQLENLDHERTRLLNLRDDADEVSLAKTAQVVAGANADPELGPNSSLIEAFGYVRQSERKSGLHRGSSSSGPPATGGSSSTGGTPPPAP